MPRDPFSRFSLRPVGLLICLLGAVLPGPALASPDRPNVVLIMGDDVGYECFGCYGSRQYKTPHIDRLAQDGLRFRHCYSQPLCTPSRVKLMTGISNVRNYSAFSVLNSDQKTIGQYMKQAGYQTAIAGKWQLLGAEHYQLRFRGKGSWPERCGFDEMCLWQVDKLGKRFWNPLLYINGQNTQHGPDDYGPDIVTRFITDFIERSTREHPGQPFFAYMPLIQVHSPFLPTPGSESRTSKNKQKNFEDMVAHMDAQVGRVVATVDRLQLARRTLIIFTGDNGTHRTIRSTLKGREIRGGKGLMTDAGTRVPLVIRWTGTVRRGQVSDHLVDFSDFLPTVLELGGLDVPCGLDGQSLAGLLRGTSDYRPRDWIHIYYCPRPERTRPQQFVRDQSFKLYDDGRFFDVRGDVLEERSLVGSDRSLRGLSPEARAALAKLQKALASMPSNGQNLLKFVPSKR